MGRLFPSAEGTGRIARSGQRVRRSAPALVGASPPPWDFGGTFPKGDRAHAPPERWSLAHDDEHRPTTRLSCPANAGHPVITNVSDYWIARWSLPSGRPKAGPLGGRWRPRA